MNMKFFRIINNLAYKNMVLDKVMIIFSKYVPYIFMAILALIFLLGIIKKNGYYRKVAMNTVVITIINLVLSFLIGCAYYVDRPFVHNQVNLLFAHVKDASFPSDHALGTMSIALGLEKCNRAVGIVLIIVSVIVGISRVYVGHHFPGDIVGAYLIVFTTNYLYNAKLKFEINNIYDKVENKFISIIR